MMKTKLTFSANNKQRFMSLSAIDDLLVCPACHADVARRITDYVCSGCHRSFPIRYGIPDFRLEPDPYISVADECRKIDGFYSDHASFAEMVKVYYELTPESPPSLHRLYMAAMDVAVLRGHGLLRKLATRFPLSRTDLLLDLGCGTGGMTIAGSERYTTVVGVDVALRWLVMGRARLAEHGIVAPLVCANAESLPFRDGTFDAVAADAVIEHVRDSSRMRDETLRVLADEGPFFFVTNNRYSILPEPHVRLFGFGLLPRNLMPRVAHLIRRTPYRARLHSRRDLKSIFAGHGEVLLPYYLPGELGKRNERLRKTWNTFSGNGIFRTLIGGMVPQYFITGSRPR